MKDISKMNLKDFQQLSESKEISNRANKIEQDRTATLILVEKLWLKMSSMYGHKFMSQFGESVDDTWVTCLAGITPRQMANGLNLCLTNHPEWPPAAVQFRSLCLGVSTDKDGSTNWQHGTKAYREFDAIGLPDKTAIEKARVVGIETLAKLKGLIDE